MQSVAAVLAQTPPFVWAILAFLAWQGFQSLRTRPLSPWRLLLVPPLVIGSGVVLLRETGGAPFALWLAAALVGAPLGVLTAPRVAAAGRGRSSVTCAGSPIPLLRNLAIFAAHYALAISAALRPDMGEAHASAAMLLSGATVGYGAGWTFGLSQAWPGHGLPRSLP